MQVNVLEAKSRLSQLIKSVQAGDEVIIANRGQPVARLVPLVVENGKAAEGGFLQWLSENPLPAYAQRTHEEIEASIQAEREAWD